MFSCRNYMCENWDCDKNGGHCMLLKCDKTSFRSDCETVSDKHKKNKKKVINKKD